MTDNLLRFTMNHESLFITDGFFSLLRLAMSICERRESLAQQGVEGGIEMWSKLPIFGVQVM